MKDGPVPRTHGTDRPRGAGQKLAQGSFRRRREAPLGMTDKATGPIAPGQGTLCRRKGLGGGKEHSQSTVGQKTAARPARGHGVAPMGAPSSPPVINRSWRGNLLARTPCNSPAEACCSSPPRYALARSHAPAPTEAAKHRNLLPGGPCVSIDMAQGTATSPELQGPGLGGLRRYERRARYSKQYE